MCCQDQFPIADVPTGIGIAKKPWGQNSDAQGQQENDENQIGNGREDIPRP